jgi:hypothetical protein
MCVMPVSLFTSSMSVRNLRTEAQNALNAAAKHFYRCYENWDGANRLAKKLKERMRNKLQKADRLKLKPRRSNCAPPRRLKHSSRKRRII